MSHLGVAPACGVERTTLLGSRDTPRMHFSLQLLTIFFVLAAEVHTYLSAKVAKSRGGGVAPPPPPKKTPRGQVFPAVFIRNYETNVSKVFVAGNARESSVATIRCRVNNWLRQARHHRGFCFRVSCACACIRGCVVVEFSGGESLSALCVCL